MDDHNSALVEIIGVENVNEMLAEAAKIRYESGICRAPDCDGIAEAGVSSVQMCHRHLAQAHHDYLAHAQGIINDPRNRVVVADDGELLDDTVPSPAQEGQPLWLAHHQAVKVAMERAKARESSPAPTQTAAVYYVRLNDLIKIGTTRNLKARMASFYAKPDAVLAIEPGDYRRETERHRQFGHLRHARSELFEPTPELLDHIHLVRETFGDPKLFL